MAGAAQDVQEPGEVPLEVDVEPRCKVVLGQDVVQSGTERGECLGEAAQFLSGSRLVNSGGFRGQGGMVSAQYFRGARRGNENLYAPLLVKI